jgi:hypothetical protein
MPGMAEFYSGASMTRNIKKKMDTSLELPGRTSDASPEFFPKYRSPPAFELAGVAP